MSRLKPDTFNCETVLNFTGIHNDDHNTIAASVRTNDAPIELSACHGSCLRFDEIGFNSACPKHVAFILSLDARSSFKFDFAVNAVNKLVNQSECGFGDRCVHCRVSLHTDCFDFICDDLQVTSDLFANDDFNAKPLIEDLIGNLGHVGVSLLPDFSNIVAMRSVVNG